MAKKNQKGASKAQDSLTNLVNAASKAVKTENVIPNDGRHVVFLKKLQFVEVSKYGVKYNTPFIRFWLGIVGKNVSFNATRFLNADFESSPVTWESADNFVRYMTGAVLSESWAKAHNKVEFEINAACAKQVVELIETARADRGTRTFVVETKAHAVDGYVNVRITRIEARIEKAVKPSSKGKASKDTKSDADYM